MIEKDIGKRIQECRKKKGITQAQLAEKISHLPMEEQYRIYEVVETLIRNAK